MKKTRDDVSDLLKRAQDGDESAMSELITIHKQLIFTIIFRMVNNFDMSMDLTQETFIKAFLNIKNVKNGNLFKAWICKIARNLAYDYFRKEKRQRTVSLEEIGERIGQSGMGKKRRSIIIQDALAQLTEKDRMLLTLAYFQGLSLSEVANIMNISKNTIKVQIHRARKRLRNKLKGRENELLSTM